MPQPSETVTALLDALAREDVDTALDLLAPDVEWRNTGLPTLRGKRARQVVKLLDRPGLGFAVRVHHIASDGPTVLTDRTDVLRSGPIATAFPVQGTFEVHDGRITVWDDHFSLRQVLTGFLRRI